MLTKLAIHITRGSLLVKILKLYLFFRLTGYALLGKTIGDYAYLHREQATVRGFFLHNGEVDWLASNVDGQIYRKHESAEEQRCQSISIVNVGNGFLVRKKYSGLKKALRFYSEIICLDTLKGVSGVPKVKYADYKNLEIYVDFMSGRSLHPRSSFDPTLLKKEQLRSVKDRVEELVRAIHSKGVVWYDVHPGNMLINDQSPVIIDFGDALPLHMIPKIVHRYLKRTDMLKVEAVLHRRMAV